MSSLEKSIRLVSENNPLFLRDWAYLRQNLSGKYRVSHLGEATEAYDTFKTKEAQTAGHIFADGAYIAFERPTFVELIKTDIDLTDFYFPNGGYNGKRYELHSLISDNKREGDAAPYTAPAADRPTSETAGIGALEVIENVWGNIPPRPANYISRTELQERIYSLLSNDRHPIVTLTGRGGIGKTSLALNTLHDLSKSDRYEAIVWFSARDVDLTEVGPKLARPDVLTERDIANSFVALFEPKERMEKSFQPVKYMAENLSKSHLDGPILFVFDNFETVRNPVALFSWIDTNVRLPNKVLITTRFRDFKADYPVEIQGMDHSEVDKLIDQTAAGLGSSALFDRSIREDIFEQSNGHPYIVKILVGEMSDKKAVSKPQKIISAKDDILQALFERTFQNISPISKRIFLMLCGWRSYIPKIAIEAVLFRNEGPDVDPGYGLDELECMSLIESRVADDGSEFVGVPLTAAVFGIKKLATSPLKTAIENDIKYLQELGSTSSSSVGKGVAQKIRKLIGNIARQISSGKENYEDNRHLLEFIATRHNDSWLVIADLVEEIEQEGVTTFHKNTSGGSLKAARRIVKH